MDLIAALRAFDRVVETGSFSAVARENRTSQSAVTRLVAQLEEHFSVRLLHRTTRRLSLTDDGRALLAHARQVLEAAEDMEAGLGRQSGSVQGAVRVGTSVAGGLFLAPRLPDLLAQHPGLSVELVLQDRLGDMIEDRLDLAWRSGEIADSSLVARLVGRLGRAAVAAPIYLERYGAPSTPEDLTQHECLIHDVGPESDVWRFTGPDGQIDVRVSARFRANDSEAVRFAARAGYGIALLPELTVLNDLRAGRMYRLLNDYPSHVVPIHLVYPSRRNLAPRTRVVMDFMIEQARKVPELLEQTVDVLT